MDEEHTVTTVSASEKEEHVRQYKDFGAEVRLLFGIITNSTLSPKEIEDVLAFKFGMRNCQATDSVDDKYNDFLVEQARYDIHFVINIEDTIRYIIMDGTHHYDFPPMPAIKRKIIHELCVHYGCTSESFRTEPQRFVRVYFNRGRVPRPRLSEIVYYN